MVLTWVENSHARLFLNGQQAGSDVALDFTPNLGLFRSHIGLDGTAGTGSASGGFYPNADVDEVKLWEGELLADAVLANFQAGRPSGGGGMPCDFNSSGGCDDADIDLLADAVRNGTSDAKFNVDGLGDPNIPDDADFDFYITDDGFLSTGLGDSDLNMIVNFVDFVNLSNDFGVNGTGWARGNFNTDENTNFNDFVALSNNFGVNFASASNVPEPAALLVLGLGALAATIRRMR